MILCKECGKEIWAIANITQRKGVEDPTYLHSVCYERLQEKAWRYEELEK